MVVLVKYIKLNELRGQLKIEIIKIRSEKGLEIMMNETEEYIYILRKVNFAMVIKIKQLPSKLSPILKTQKKTFYPN